MNFEVVYMHRCHHQVERCRAMEQIQDQQHAGVRGAMIWAEEAIGEQGIHIEAHMN